MKGQHSWNDKVQLKHTLSLVGVLATLALVLSGVIHNHAIQFLEQRANVSEQLAKTMEDFDTLHGTISEEYVLIQEFLRSGHREAYEQWKRMSANNSAALQDIRAKLPKDTQLPQEFDNISKTLTPFITMSKQAVSLRQALGLNEQQGLRGSLRTVVHQVEHLLKQEHQQALSISMLMMRRHEKDFMLGGDEKYVDEQKQEYAHFQKLLATSALSAAKKQHIQDSIQKYFQQFLAYVEGYQALAQEQTKLQQEFQAQLSTNLNRFDEDFAAYIQHYKQDSYVQQHSKDNQFMVLMGIVLLVLLALLFGVARSILGQVRVLTGFAERLAGGNLEEDLRLGIRPHAKGELQVLLRLMEKMRVNLCRNHDVMQRQADESLRIQQALDVCGSQVMIADADYRIFYMNESLKAMLKGHEQVLRQALPNFHVDQVVGSCMDDFHRNPAHQRSVLDALRAPYTSEDLNIHGLWLRVTATPVFNKQGNRIATVTEWEDRTQQLMVEQEVSAFVQAAEAGDFSVSIQTEGKAGFLLRLSESLNGMAERLSMALTDTTRALKALEDGDLTHRITGEYQGVYNDIKQAANNASEKLAEVLGQVRETAMNVADGSSEIAQGNTTLSDRTQEQAAALEETSASVEELSGTVQQNADNARQANQLAVTTSEQAEQGQLVVKQAIEAVGGISQSSKKIADIIGVIDEIAFQTNLLALNAAVEAARAGEQGRGFAVVAGEVRTLAGRSAEAAKEIKDLIGASVESVEQGSKLVFDSGEALDEIVRSVQKVTDIIAEIAAAGQEQSAGIDQINKAITQLDGAVQQNAALVEETAASASNLDQESGELLSMVENFELGQGGSSRRSRATQAARPATPVQRSTSSARATASHTARPQADDDVWEEF